MKKILYVILICLFFSCNHRNNSEINTIAASYGDSIIQLNEVDNMARQEIYDELNRIYIIRKTTLDLLIKEKLLLIEAKKQKISKEALLNNYFLKNSSENKIKKFILRNGLENGIPELKRTLSNVRINTKEGQSLLYEEYKRFLIDNFVDSLRNIYKVNNKLVPPPPLNISLINDLNIHFRGNQNSKVFVLEISDLECDKCREAFPMMDSIYKKYQTKVKFGFTHFSSYATLSAIATEVAAKQGKFWEMHNLIFQSKNLPDTSVLLTFARQLNLNEKAFKDGLANNSFEKSMTNNFNRLNSLGIFATPTFIINGKVIFNSSSKNEIDNAIKNELNNY